MTTIPGVDFVECYPKRTVFKVDDVEVTVIDLEGLKKNKKASGRLQDLADVQDLDTN